MHPAMAAAAAAAFCAPREDEEEVEEGLSGGRFSSARPAVVTHTQQFFPTTAAAAQQQAVERCVLAGATAAATGAARWSRPASRAKSSQYRGVTFNRRWVSRIRDCGKPVHLGGFDTAHAAARAYDQAAIKFRGVDADINFSLDDYKEHINKMSGLSKEEFVRGGSSRFRGVTLHRCGKWEARIRQLMGKKFVHLGLYDTEMDAANKLRLHSLGESMPKSGHFLAGPNLILARGLRQGAINSRGEKAVTNFEQTKVATCDGEVGLQPWGSEPDLELSLGCSGGSGGDHTTAIDGETAQGNRRTSLTFEMPEEEEETAACYSNRNRSIWIRPSSRVITPPNPAGGDHQPTSSTTTTTMLQMGQISGGGRDRAELRMPGWPIGGGNHWYPYAAEAAAASSGFPPAPGRGEAAAGWYGVRNLDHHRLESWRQQGNQAGVP